MEMKINHFLVVRNKNENFRSISLDSINFLKKCLNREIGTAVFDYFGTVTGQSAYSILKRLDFMTWQRRISYCSIRVFVYIRKKVH
jgi:hypothetical protein